MGCNGTRLEVTSLLQAGGDMAWTRAITADRDKSTDDVDWVWY